MIQQKLTEAREQIERFSIESKEALEAFRLQFLSKKGVLTGLFEMLKSVPVDEKKQTGKLLNELKVLAESRLRQFTEQFENSTEGAETGMDLTLPPVAGKVGNLHPLSLTRYRIIEVFERL